MTCLLNPQIDEQVDLACEYLLQGEAVALPAETVYGLAARVDQDSALSKIFALKNRPTFDPLIVHVLKNFDLSPWVKTITPLHRKLIEKFWPGPLTLLFERSSRVSDLCTASSDFVAFRAPEHKVFQKILSKVKIPLAAPSANRFGKISPTSSQDVLDELGPYGLTAVLEGGRCQWGVESTVVKIVHDLKIEILRLGSLSVEDLQNFLGPQVEIVVSKKGSGMNEEQMESPGQMLSHYAPSTPVKIVRLETLKEGSQNVALLSVSKSHTPSLPEGSFFLTSGDDDKEAAVNLFATLRKLDSQGYQEIQVILGPEKNLYRAINERLVKASGKSLA